MISGLVLKYLNGECFVIRGFYKYTRLASTEFNLTVPVNELTSESRKALIDRYVTMVIATPLQELCCDLVEMMVDAVAGKPNTTPSQHFLTPQLYVPESF
jgi:hypothetical protein